MDVLYRGSVICGAVATFATLFVLAVADRSVPLVNAVLATGVPVVYYRQVMVLLLSGAIGILVALVVSYLGSGKRYHKSRQKDYSKRLLGYGGVGFLTLGAPALLMDPAAMSVGMGLSSSGGSLPRRTRRCESHRWPCRNREITSLRSPRFRDSCASRRHAWLLSPGHFLYFNF